MSHFVITIARGYGSGGRTIGQMLAERLGVKYYDRDLIRLASDASGIHVGLFGEADEHAKKSLFKRKKDKVAVPGDPAYLSEDNLFKLQAQAIRELAEKESCIIVGRAADHVLADNPDVVRVFVHAPEEACVKTLGERYGMPPKEAIHVIREIDDGRAHYYRVHTGHEWNDARNYDLGLNSDALGFDKCVDAIIAYLKVKFGSEEF